MIFITGPLYSGKREYARLLLGCTREELAQRAVWDVQELAAGCSCKVKNSENSVLGEMLAALGCVNIADSDASLLEELSMEAILAADPELSLIHI